MKGESNRWRKHFLPKWLWEDHVTVIGYDFGGRSGRFESHCATGENDKVR